MPEPVSIIIPAFNQLHFCRQCVESVLTNTDRGTYRLILVNNGSTDGVGEYFDSIESALVVHAPENKGFAAGVNLGLAEATGHVLLLNSDTVVPREWLPRLRAALEKDENVGMAGPMSNCVSGPQWIHDLEFSTADDLTVYSDRLYAERGGEFQVTERLVGFCVLIRDEALAAVGNFDEQFGIGNYEDDDYGYRVRKAGFELRIALDCFVFHFGSRTFLGMGIEGKTWEELLARNGEKYRAKWNTQLEFDRSTARKASFARNRDARDALTRSDRNGALRLLTEAIRNCPDLAVNYNDLGAVLWEMGERDRAIRLFRRALALDPELAEARENLAAANTPSAQR